MKIAFTKTSQPKTKRPETDLGFGVHFTDHMFLMEFHESKGWHSARIEPYAPLQLDPAACCLHYSQEIFEGLKAYRNKDGQPVLFRPGFNAQRMATGAERLCMPPPPPELFQEGLKELLKVDQDWIPRKPGNALYIRPTLIGTEPFLGIRPAKEFLFFIILSPVGSYYKEGLNPVKIWVEEKYTRAAPGGLGATKAGANYAASLIASESAKKKGFTQVLWTDAFEHRYVEEVGTMNVFFKIDGKVVTPLVGGTILNGGTRECVIQLLRDFEVPIEERKISVDEIFRAHKEGVLQEIFGTGTAAVISPVGHLGFRDEIISINDGKTGALSQRLYQEITGIQSGQAPDKYGWVQPI